MDLRNPAALATSMDEETIIEAMALAICNAIRDDRDLPALTNLGNVQEPGQYRKQARCALRAYRNVAFGR